MVTFQFSRVTPLPLLQPYVAKICLFESNGQLPAQDNKLIVPNANLKLTLTWRNGIVANIAGKTFTQTEHQLSLTGLIDVPVWLDPQKDERTGTIIIEFTPIGAYRLFHLSYTGIKNQIIDLEDIMGNRAATLRARLADAATLGLKLQQLQDFLLQQLERSAPDLIYDHCINRIASSAGMITVAQLQKETGYTSRWLHTKFSERLGAGPKNLLELVRFRQCYQAYTAGAQLPGFKDHIYHYYHDQSHFIRAFKRFTGFTPTSLLHSSNELATRHYNS